MITRLLFWLALVLLVLMAARSKLKGEFKRPPAPGRAREDGAKVEVAAEAMACCAHCALHFPASESVRVGDRDYCCAAHAGLPPA